MNIPTMYRQIIIALSVAVLVYSLIRSSESSADPSGGNHILVKQPSLIPERKSPSHNLIEGDKQQSTDSASVAIHVKSFENVSEELSTIRFATDIINSEIQGLVSLSNSESARCNALIMESLEKIGQERARGAYRDGETLTLPPVSELDTILTDLRKKLASHLSPRRGLLVYFHSLRAEEFRYADRAVTLAITKQNDAKEVKWSYPMSPKSGKHREGVSRSVKLSDQNELPLRMTLNFGL